jgi:hypothetical protein
MNSPEPSPAKSYLPFAAGAVIALGVVGLATLPSYLEMRARSSAEAFCTGQWKKKMSAK